MNSKPTVLRTRSEVRAYIAEQKKHGHSIGFVPTMGALHAGHASLLLEARKKQSKVVLSIFVNPAQFGPSEDLAKYPRTLDADLSLASQCGVDLVFAPDVSEIYPAGFTTAVSVGQDLARVLEGAARPGHFDGVCLVVLILLNIVQAQEAYFGMKDYQQVVVLQHLLADIAHPTRLVALPTVRDHDGLALSSRNRFLGGDSRALSRIIPFSLSRAWMLFQGGERNAQLLLAEVKKCILSFNENAIQEMPGSLQRLVIDYVECLELGTLRKCTGQLTGNSAIVIAVRVKVLKTATANAASESYEVRLLDNLILSTEAPWLQAGSDLAGFFSGHHEFSAYC